MSLIVTAIWRYGPKKLPFAFSETEIWHNELMYRKMHEMWQDEHNTAENY